jgi:hypothetical protein
MLEESNPRAVPRWPGGRTPAMENPKAGIAAEPAAWSIRPATRKGRFGARAQTIDPAASPRRPKENVRRRL